MTHVPLPETPQGVVKLECQFCATDAGFEGAATAAELGWRAVLLQMCGVCVVCPACAPAKDQTYREPKARFDRRRAA